MGSWEGLRDSGIQGSRDHWITAPRLIKLTGSGFVLRVRERECAKEKGEDILGYDATVTDGVGVARRAREGGDDRDRKRESGERGGHGSEISDESGLG